ncbi:hypothetical protein AJ80_04655 [Polytolypa hystricis UAMH7299]|uniref:SET domain-containing protein n=1 Tax=Polytolypa hystricis (strain UAMH7299) TaxID=1447883 RepID=A0A2B7YAE4_POLH7|nr:hypothetical protein AJ80_04655 [Polytolypa hystricis UAMH7299]
MTDTSSVATTNPTTNFHPVTASPLISPVPNGKTSHIVHDDEEEPYTIKCICDFEDDDGSTVFCERCETWQHIVCYYHGQDVPDIHNCADCEPRALDAKRAAERQRRLREQNESGDRKGKRSGTKNPKKKSKDVEHSNGWTSHERSGSNSVSRDQPPPAKKAKTGHRSSNSVSSSAGMPVLAPDNRKRAASMSTSAMSPNKASSTFSQIPLYSQEFLHLYDHDKANVDMQSNLFDTIGLAGDLAKWVQDPLALAQVANGRSPNEIFTDLDQPLDSSKWPVISRQSRTDTSIDYDGRHPTWQFIKVENYVRKDEIVGEVRGKIGHLHDYCLDPSSRWQELRHPEPFVFFHPQLPVYIDSRKEGTQLRYIRRSCQPNVTLKTFITNQVEYHFCFVATQDIPASSEITAMWYLDPQMFTSTNGFVKQDGSSFATPDSTAICISNVLAHFGGCACNSQNCLLAKLDRRRPPKALDAPSKSLNGKRKKQRAKATVSPISTGRATNSRAGSEAARAQDEDDHMDSRSTSGSVQDQPRSRDLTPTGHSPNDILGLSGGELTARERRKIAAAEKKFEQLEQDNKQHPQKRKKRSSGVSTQPNSAVSAAPRSKSLLWQTLRAFTDGDSLISAPFSQQTANPPRLDTSQTRRSSSSPVKLSPRSSSTPRRGSHSSARKPSGPNTPVIGSPLGRPQYVDSEMQTEPDEHDPHYVPPKPTPRHSFVPLTKRLLKRCYEDRLRLEEENRMSPVTARARSPMVSPLSTGTNDGAIRSQRPQEDVEMKDADTSMTPPKARSWSSILSAMSTETSPPNGQPRSESPFKLPPHPWPSAVAHHLPVLAKPTNGMRADLRVQLPAPQFTSPGLVTPNASTPSSVQSPLSVKTTVSHPPGQSPGSSITAPSPVKKKLSLGDYMSRRGTLTTPTTEKSQSQALPLSQTSPVAQISTNSLEGARPALPMAKPPGEEMKRESPAPVDVVMQDIPYSPTSPPDPASCAATSTAARDPRLQHRS